MERRLCRCAVHLYPCKSAREAGKSPLCAVDPLLFLVLHLCISQLTRKYYGPLNISRLSQSLLLGWDGSPLKTPYDEGRVRNIPMPTRRPTLKEAVRVYDELSTAVISPFSLAAEEKPAPETKEPAANLVEKPAASTSPAANKSSSEKGTDHLKKRDEKPHPGPEPAPPPQIDEDVASMLTLVLADERDSLADALGRDAAAASLEFGPHYLPSGDARFAKVEAPLGMVGVAALLPSAELVEWLLDHDVSPCVGFSPYTVTKNKHVRTMLRRYWARHPERYDYAAAGVPSPLTQDEEQAQAEKDREKRRKDRHRKKEREKERAQERFEAAKTPLQRARELRAAAAEARLLGNKCAFCRRDLSGLTPFERLSYKYCSVECVNKHRQQLNAM